MLKSKTKNENIYVITNSLINHKGSILLNEKLNFLETGTGCGQNFILIENTMVFLLQLKIYF